MTHAAADSLSYLVRIALRAGFGIVALLWLSASSAQVGDPFDLTALKGKVVYLDFWASWCGPGLAMVAAYESATAELEPGFRLLKVNADEEQQLMAQFGIRGIPTLMLFANATQVARQAGAMNTRDIVAWVQSHAPK